MSNENKKTALPKLRFPEFQEAEGWVEKKLGNILVEARLGSNFQTSEASSGTPVIKMVNLNRGRINIDKVEYLAGSSTYNEYDLLKAGDLLFNTRNTLDLVGKVAIWNNELPLAVYNTNLLRLVFDNKVVSSNYFMNYLLNTRESLGKLRSIATGTTSVAAIYSKDLNKLTVNIPSPEEQQKIAATLSSLDDLLTAQSAKLKTLKAHKRGLMQGLFPAEGETVPKLRFPEFQEAEEWGKEKLGELTQKVGSGITPTGGDKNYKTEGIPFVRSQNIGWGALLLDDITFIDQKTHYTFLATEIKEHDVLLNITGASIGRCAIADSRIVGGNVNQHVCIIRTLNELNPFFLSQYLIAEGGQNQINSFQAGGNRQGLNFVQIRSFQVPIPPTLEEQKKIADCLSSLDRHITAQNLKIKALELHKKGLMQRLFSTLTNSEV